MINCFDNSQKFLPGCVIVTFWFAQCLAGLVDLRQNSTNTNIAGICVSQKGVLALRIGQDWSGCEGLFEAMKRTIAFLCPRKRLAFLSQLGRTVSAKEGST